MSRVGSRVGGRFTLLELAGRGGMGEVYRARDEVVGLTVAIKLFCDGGAEAAGRFGREVEALSRIQHAAVVEPVAHGVDEDGTFYLAMEWLEGEDLSKRLEQGPLSIDEVHALGVRLADALAVAHVAGIVHRDIKPSNVFLVGGQIARAKLLDFGLARGEGGRSLTRAGEAIGTPAYMAPEQAKGSVVDARADVFSLGCVLFECAAGQPPFWAEHPLAVMAKILLDEPPRLSALRPDVPSELAGVVESMLAKSPADRLADGAAVRDALTRAARTSRHVEMRNEGVPPSIGARERQLLSVVFVGGVEDAVTGVDEQAPTMVAEQSSGEIDAVYGAVLKSQGWAERLIDGSIVITIPGSGPAPDQAAAAARCALEVRRSMPKHPMVLVTGRTDGNEGFPVGEVLDRGARLLAPLMSRPTAGAAPAGIAIDDVTAGLLDRRFTIAGSDGGLRLVGQRDVHAAGSTLLGRPSPFVGRERELSALVSAYEASQQDRRAQAVVVVGAPGAGKSRLRHELLVRLEGRHPAPTVLIGSSDTIRGGSALGLFASAMADLFGLQEGESGEVSLHRVRARVSRHVPRDQRDRVAAFLGELVGVPFPDHAHELLAAARLDRARLGDQIREAIEDFFAAELAAGPVVLVLEDLHAGDAPTVTVVDAALRIFAEQPLFVLALARPEVQAAFPQLWRDRPLVEMGLRPLGTEAARQIVEAALGAEAAADLVERVVTRSGGNAFYVEELVRAIAAGRGDRLPETVVAMVEANLDALDPDVRRVLRAASVLGMQFSLEGLSALLPEQGQGSLSAIITRLLDSELVVRAPRAAPGADGGYRFASELVRAAAYAKLTDEDRAIGHRAAGAWLESVAGPRDALTVADHFDRAGETRRAALWYARAAEIALDQGDFAEAVDRADRGAVAGATDLLLGRTRLLQSEALRHLGDNARMLERAREAMTLLPARTPGWWTAAANAILGATRTGDKARCEQLAAEIIGGPLTPNPALARVGVYLLHMGKHDDAVRVLAALEPAMSDPTEPASKWAWGHRAAAYLAMFSGDVGGYLGHAERAVRAFQAAGDGRELALELVALGYARHELGLYAEAVESLRAGLRISERLGLRHVGAAAQENLGAVLLRQGALDEAERALETALESFVAQGNRRMEGHCRKQIGKLWQLRGEADAALEHVLHASQILAAFPPLLPSTLALGASILLSAGKTVEGVLMARDAAAALDAVANVEEGEAAVRLVFVQALDAAGDRPGAAEALRIARDRILERARKITDEAARQSFLENVEENATTIELARSWAV